MAWVIPTVQNVLDNFNDAEQAKVTGLLASTGNPEADLMQQATQLFRGALRVGGIMLDAAGTLDDSLISDWASYVRWKLLGRLAMAALQTKGRKDDYDQAIETLAKCRDGKWGVATPVNPTSETTQVAGSPVTTVFSRHFGMRRESGW